jgi:hypothetical protein
MVNTFMLSSDYKITAKLLDRQRLGKQRVEAKQIIEAIASLYIHDGSKWVPNPNPSKWMHHPATRMWLGYATNLMVYFNVITQEWIERGYKNNLLFYTDNLSYIQPPWTYWKQVHYSHMASLMRKDVQYYHDKLSYPYIYNLHGYVWESKLPEEMKIKLTKGENVELDKICEPINTNITSAEKKRREENYTFYYQVCIAQFTREYMK